MPWKPGESGNPGGRPRLAQGIRRRAQNDADEAYEVLLSVMRGAEKSSERATAAKTILQLAGAAMSEDKTQPPPEDKPLTPSASTEDLMAAASKGEA